MYNIVNIVIYNIIIINLILIVIIIIIITIPSSTDIPEEAECLLIQEVMCQVGDWSATMVGKLWLASQIQPATCFCK